MHRLQVIIGTVLLQLLRTISKSLVRFLLLVLKVIIVKSDTELGVDLEEVVTFQKHLKTILKPLI